MSDPRRFFTEPHYDRFPTALIRLDKIRAAERRPLLIDAWSAQAPKALVAKFRE